MHLRSGKFLCSGEIPWPIIPKVSVYYDNYVDMRSYIIYLFEKVKSTNNTDKTLNRLVFLETCELLCLNKHLQFRQLRDVAISTLKDATPDNFDKFAYIEKLENLY